MKGKIIILYSADKKILEKKGKWLTTHLMRIFPLVENITHHKQSPFNETINQEHLQKLDDGIWLVIEDYSLLHQLEDNSCVNIDIEILLDGNKGTQVEEYRYHLLGLAIPRQWHVVNTDQNTGIIRQHIWDCVEPLIKTPRGIYPGVFLYTYLFKCSC